MPCDYTTWEFVAPVKVICVKHHLYDFKKNLSTFTEKEDTAILRLFEIINHIQFFFEN